MHSYILASIQVCVSLTLGPKIRLAYKHMTASEEIAVRASSFEHKSHQSRMSRKLSKLALEIQGTTNGPPSARLSPREAKMLEALRSLTFDVVPWLGKKCGLSVQQRRLCVRIVLRLGPLFAYTRLWGVYLLPVSRVPAPILGLNCNVRRCSRSATPSYVASESHRAGNELPFDDLETCRLERQELQAIPRARIEARARLTSTEAYTDTSTSSSAQPSFRVRQ